MTEADRTGIDDSTSEDADPGRGSLPEVPNVPPEDVPKPDPDKDQG